MTKVTRKLGNKTKRYLSLFLAIAVAFTTIAVAFPLKSSAKVVASASNLKSSYDVKLDWSFGFGNGILYKTNMTFTGKQNNGTGNGSVIKSITGQRIYNMVFNGGCRSGTHFEGTTTSFPTSITDYVDTNHKFDLHSDTINYKIYVKNYITDKYVEIPGSVKIASFKTNYTFSVPEKYLPKIDSAFIDVKDNKNTVTVSAAPQTIETNATFGDQYGVKWTGKTGATYKITDKNGNALTLKGVSVDNTGKVTVTKDASNENGDPQSFCVTVTANGKSATTKPITIKTNKYKVTFKNANDGTFEEQEIAFGYSAKTPDTTPPYEGHTFKNWDKDYSGITADLEVSPVYDINKYTVTFKDFKGNVIEEKTDVSYGKTVAMPAAPDVTGYTFDKWQSGDNTVDDKTVITDNLTVNAKYTINKYTVTFKDYDGTELGSSTVDYNTAADVPTATKTGYKFADWVDSKDSTKVITDFSAITNDMEVTASYTINQYTVTFKADDDTIGTQTVDYGATATAPADPTKTGYKFDGWDTSLENITADTTINAKFTQIPAMVVEDQPAALGGLQNPVVDVPEDTDSALKMTLVANNKNAMTVIDQNAPLGAVNTADSTNIAAFAAIALLGAAGTAAVLKKKNED